MSESERVVDIAANAVLVVEAARAFVQWHVRGQSQPRTPDSFYPMTYAQQEAWHQEWDKRLDALISAVSALDAGDAHRSRGAAGAGQTGQTEANAPGRSN